MTHSLNVLTSSLFFELKLPSLRRRQSESAPILSLFLLEFEVTLNVILHLLVDLSILLVPSSPNEAVDTDNIQEEDSETNAKQMLMCPSFGLDEVCLVAKRFLQIVGGITHLRQIIDGICLAYRSEDWLPLEFSGVLLSIDIHCRCE